MKSPFRSALATALLVAAAMAALIGYAEANNTPVDKFPGNLIAASPDPVPVTYPVRCDADYLLAAGERAVITCTAYDHRVRVNGSVLLQSGHADVDVALIQRLPLGYVVLSATNRSSDPVAGAVRVEIY